MATLESNILLFVRVKHRKILQTKETAKRSVGTFHQSTWEISYSNIICRSTKQMTTQCSPTIEGIRKLL